MSAPEPSHDMYDLPSGALDRLDIISAPSLGQGNVMDMLRAGLRSAQDALEKQQQSAFGGASEAQGATQMVVASLCPLHGPIIQAAASELLYKYRCDLPTASLKPFLDRKSRLCF